MGCASSSSSREGDGNRSVALVTPRGGDGECGGRPLGKFHHDITPPFPPTIPVRPKPVSPLLPLGPHPNEGIDAIYEGIDDIPDEDDTTTRRKARDDGVIDFDMALAPTTAMPSAASPEHRGGSSPRLQLLRSPRGELGTDCAEPSVTSVVIQDAVGFRATPPLVVVGSPLHSVSSPLLRRSASVLKFRPQHSASFCTPAPSPLALPEAARDDGGRPSLPHLQDEPVESSFLLGSITTEESGILAGVTTTATTVV